MPSAPRAARISPPVQRDKRSALVAAAVELVREQGLARTTLADVAGRAQVPLGNVYYYFNTKAALTEAVIAAHRGAQAALFASIEAGRADPRQRLRALIRATLTDAPRIIEFGCPYGGLTQELDKLGPQAPLAQAGAQLLLAYVDWAQRQFRALGLGSVEARDRATELVAAAQGAMLLAHTLRSERVLRRQLRLLEQRV